MKKTKETKKATAEKTAKAFSRMAKQLGLGVLAGLSIGVGGLCYTALRAYVPGPGGIALASLSFSIGLFLVCVCRFSLYTGKIGLYLERKPTFWGGADLLAMLIGNAGGAVLLGYLVHLSSRGTDLAATAEAIASARALPFVEAPEFGDYLALCLRGAFCGLCVYLAVKCFAADRLGWKGTALLVFFVFLFVHCGFEHCIANFYYFAAANRWGADAAVDLLFVVLFNSLGTLPGIALWKAAEKSGIGESRRLEGGDSK